MTFRIAVPGTGRLGAVRPDVYNKTIEPSSTKNTAKDILVWLLAPILVAIASLAVWSNHFDSVFQNDDVHVIVNNRAIRSLGNIPEFFVRPLIYADRPEYAEYRPLAETSFAFDYSLANPINPAVYSGDSFAWFLFAVLVSGLLAGLISGANRWAALFAAALIAFDPVTGETVNYASRRGDIMGAAALACGFLCWIVWPHYLPKEVMHWEGVPKTDWDDFKRRWAPRLNSKYRAFINFPLHLYLIPVICGLFADPGVAVFPLLLLVYLLLFDRDPKKASPWLRVLPSAVVCGGFYVAQLAVTWKYAVGFRQPAVRYWLTQPWVAFRCLKEFLLPFRLTASSDLETFLNPWSVRALGGFAGFAAIVVLAVRMGRRQEWRAASFGLWWFLISLLPTMLVPQRAVESDGRVFVALFGIALASTRICWVLYRRIRSRVNPVNRAVVDATAIFLAVSVLVAGSVLTYQRTKVWTSQEEFWRDVTDKSPGNGRAFIELGAALIASDQYDQGTALIRRAVPLVSRDPPDEVRLAQALDLIGDEKGAKEHYQRAIAANEKYATAWSAYSQWLLGHQALADAFKVASHAVKISPWNIEAQHTILEYYSRTGDWDNVLKAATTLLSHDPTDEEGQRYRDLAKAAFDQVKTAEDKAKSGASVDDYLALSVQYYKTHRFEESIAACEQALKIQPELAEAYSNEAASYYVLGKDEQAIHALREAIRIRPDMDIAKQNLAFLLSEQSKLAKQAAPH